MTKIKMPSISYVVARSRPGNVIGCENRLPWNLRTDLRFFRQTTSSHVVIMGRKTLESIGKPLPNRVNIVLSKNENRNSSEVIWVKNHIEALFWADYHTIINEKSQFFVIGGSEIYKHFENFFNKIYLTEVFGNFPSGDAFFNYEFDFRKWKTIDEIDYRKNDFDDYDFRISVYQRRIEHVRQREISEFMTDRSIRDLWVNERTLEVRAERAARAKQEQIELPMPV